MNRATICLCGFLILGMAASAAQDKAPAIEFEKASVDLGKLTEGETIKHVFKFANKGQGMLEIFKVEPS